MFLLFPCCLVSFPLPSQVPPLCCQVVVLVYKYLISPWPHPVSQMRCSSFCTYMGTYFNLNDSSCCLSTQWWDSFLFCCILIYLIFPLLESENQEIIHVFPQLIPLMFVLKLLSHYHCRDFCSWLFRTWFKVDHPLAFTFLHGLS